MSRPFLVCLAMLTVFNNAVCPCRFAEAKGNYEQHQSQPERPNPSVEQQAGRAAQEQAVRAQEEQGRQAQQNAMKQQQQVARQAQQQQQQQQRQAQQQQQQQERQAQQQQQQQERQAQRQQEEQLKQQDQVAQQENRAEENKSRERQPVAAQENVRNQNIGSMPNTVALARPIEQRPLQGKTVSLHQAISMPVLEQNISPAEHEHAQSVIQNLQTHLTAIPAAQIPRDFAQISNNSLSQYTNNYPVYLNNQRFLINPQNTYINNVPQYEYPYWWHPNSGWVFSNGFTFGSTLNCGLDWLRWGWHPYYGPPPDGFVCATNYVPTPWIYCPAYGLWRQPGLMGWSPSGPPYDYTGPITVEMLEPRHVSVRDPFMGAITTRIINVPYFYNAYFHPHYDRWGYTNRHGYFVWLNL